MPAKTLPFSQFIDQVAAKTQATKQEAKEWVETVFGVIEKNLKNGVRVPSFGKFSLRELKARVGRNPQTGETLKIPARLKVAFAPAKDLKDKLNAKLKK